MDELQMVRDLYPEPAPPTARERAGARALTEPSRRTRPRLRWSLAAVAAVGAAAAVAVTLTSGRVPPAGPPPQKGNATAPQQPVNLDPKAAILLAATKAAQQPTGRYWHTDMVSGQSYIVRPASGAAYAITGAATETFSWWGIKTGTGESFWDRNLPAGPVTASDEAAWHAAGSPSSFRVWSSDHYATYMTATTPWQLDHPNANGGGEFAGGKSAADLQHLPADSAKLAKLYYSPAALAKAGVPKGASVGAKVALTAFMLGDAPLPPKVQAGFIRALSDQPGVHAIGNLTDPLGRRGVALASDDHAVTVTSQFGAPQAEQGTYRSRQVLIFNPSNGSLLAEEEQLTTPGGAYAREKPGFVINYLAVRSAGWTSTQLTPPARLPSR